MRRAIRNGFRTGDYWVGSDDESSGRGHVRTRFHLARARDSTASRILLKSESLDEVRWLNEGRRQIHSSPSPASLKMKNANRSLVMVPVAPE